MLRAPIRHALRDLSNLLYPPRCVGCAAPVPGDDSPSFCPTCDAALCALASTPVCDRCAAPLPSGSACPRCAGAGIHPFQSIAALGPFRDPLRRIIHQMKYHHRWPVAEILADRMSHQPRIRQLLSNTDILIPVPLHWSRQIARGYNQADSLARRLSHHYPRLRIARPLTRLKRTTPQTTMRAIADRAANLRFAFGLLAAPTSIQGQRITLVDDVMTTASTLKAAARALKEAAPAEINALLLAVADSTRRDFQAV